MSFSNHKNSVHLPINCKCCPSNDILTIFSIQMHGRSKLTLREIGQGHPSVMIYTNFVDLRSLMLNAKSQNHRPSGSEEEAFNFFCYL